MQGHRSFQIRRRLFLRTISARIRRRNSRNSKRLEHLEKLVFFSPHTAREEFSLPVISQSDISDVGQFLLGLMRCEIDWLRGVIHRFNFLKFFHSLHNFPLTSLLSFDWPDRDEKIIMAQCDTANSENDDRLIGTRTTEISSVFFRSQIGYPSRFGGLPIRSSR